MKILHVINNLGSGGAEKLLEYIVPLLNKREDTEADILLLTNENNVFFDSLVSQGVNVYTIKYNSLYDPRNIIEINKYINSGKYNIVHSHVFPTQYWVALSKVIFRYKDVKFITTEHSTHNRRRDKRWFRPLEKFIYSKYDLILSITNETKQNLIKWIAPKKRHQSKHLVVENGVDLRTIKESIPYEKKELIKGITEKTKLVGMIGRFSEAKDQPTLIKSIKNMQNNVHLILVGEGPLMNDNLELVKKLNLQKRVHFLGFRKDVSRILKTVDVVVLSSKWEGFGLAAVEGMAAGKPVIVSDVKGLNGVVLDKELKFKYRDIEDLTKKINALLNSEQKYHQKVKYSNERSEDFNIQKKVIELINIYKYQ